MLYKNKFKYSKNVVFWFAPKNGNNCRITNVFEKTDKLSVPLNYTLMLLLIEHGKSSISDLPRSFPPMTFPALFDHLFSPPSFVRYLGILRVMNFLSIYILVTSFLYDFALVSRYSFCLTEIACLIWLEQFLKESLSDLSFGKINENIPYKKEYYTNSYFWWWYSMSLFFHHFY